MQTIILGVGHLGRAVAAAAAERGERTHMLGRPAGPGHDPAAFADADLVVDATHAAAVAPSVEAALGAGVRRFVIATTGWSDARPAVDAALRGAGASAVVAANFSLGVALFSRLVETAAELFGGVEGFDPYLLEWHRRAKADRPSATAVDLAARLTAGRARVSSADALEVVSIRAGASPGMHLVGFDAPGETVELRLTARDRTAYAAGILATTDWLRRAPRAPGIHAFDLVVDELLAARPDLAA